MGRTDELRELAAKSMTEDDYRALSVADIATVFCDYKRLLAENARLEAERDAAIADINSLRGRSCPCHICEFVDMIRCCHHDHCGEKHEFFKRRGAQPATGAEERGENDA